MKDFKNGFYEILGGSARVYISKNGKLFEVVKSLDEDFEVGDIGVTTNLSRDFWKRLKHQNVSKKDKSNVATLELCA